MDEWQPIETAPRGGTVIRIRQNGWRPCHAKWEGGGWKVVEYQGTHNPTHWQPIPAPAAVNR